MLLAGCGDGGVLDPGPACGVSGDAPTLEAEQVLLAGQALAIQLQQSGRPANRSRLEVPLSKMLDHCAIIVDLAEMRLETHIENPATGQPENKMVPSATPALRPVCIPADEITEF